MIYKSNEFTIYDEMSEVPESVWYDAAQKLSREHPYRMITTDMFVSYPYLVVEYFLDGTQMFSVSTYRGGKTLRIDGTEYKLRSLPLKE